MSMIDLSLANKHHVGLTNLIYHNVLGITSPKVRGITKSNTMSNATGRSVGGQVGMHDKQRRSAYEPSGGRDGAAGKLSGSTDKTSIGLEQSDVSQAK